MLRRPLTLQPSTQQIDGIDGTSANRTTETAHQRQREVARQRVFLVLDAFGLHVALNNALLEVLEGEEVDRRVREHSYQTHRKTSVIAAETGGAPHFLRSLDDECVAFGGAGYSFALRAELECVEWVDNGLRDHACQATGDELRCGSDVLWVVVAFKFGDCAFTSLR